jgi:hypothetical protein
MGSGIRQPFVRPDSRRKLDDCRATAGGAAILRIFVGRFREYSAETLANG